MWCACLYVLPCTSAHTSVQGHLSIVNSTLIHPVLPLIATAGIERQVLLHSPTPNTSWASNLPLTSTTTRPLPSTGPTPADPSVLRLLMRLSTIMEADESMGEDARSIAYFDMYVTPRMLSVLVSRVFPTSTRTDGTRTVPVGFCNGRAKGTYLRYDNRRCRRMTTLTMGTRLS